MSPFRAMPAELVDLVIDHAHTDLSLLAVCSLVCKAWFPAARHHLFSSTKLNAKNASSFARLLNSASSSVAGFVRHIDANDSCEGGRWIDDIFPSLASLPFVTSISLTPSCDTILSQSTLSTLCTFDRLVDLKLAECEFRDFAEVQRLIVAFPMLQSLYLEADWPEPHAIAPTEISPSSHLREVYLRCEMSHILGWFLLQPHLAPVNKLTLHGLDSIDLPVTRRYLQALGSSLTHLTILPNGSIISEQNRTTSRTIVCSPYAGTFSDCISRQIDLSLNPSLAYLKLSIDCDYAYLGMTCALFSQITSRAFDEVELSLYSVRQGPKVASAWSDLDALLATPQLAMVRTTISAMSAASLAKETLPLCHKRGVLQVRHQ
ncbi:hypothetical protein H0H81_010278 [Sphagnurus paluster]|uniref:F-box domain-containing protein n=1 Tax=Sphagnurus paluster TaxID=117069 RepID=A0A9P7GR20_9AGAR|nr:hypothetical protein H0H81_010278 [Sphagnurus paluster]